ncbi:MAG: hypothetical protein KAV87_45650 [Desulfobacteraceae bacterium]|nr:hypothetical protein [Desulfobacteraceae bacterium]
MFNIQLFEYFIFHPIPEPVRRLAEGRMTYPQTNTHLREIMYARDLFIAVICDIYRGINEPPKTFRLFDKTVKRGGLVRYHPEVSSWQELLTRTTGLLLTPAPPTELRRRFETWLPRQLGWLSDLEIARFYRDLELSLRPAPMKSGNNIDNLQQLLNTIRKDKPK